MSDEGGGAGWGVTVIIKNLIEKMELSSVGRHIQVMAMIKTIVGVGPSTLEVDLGLNNYVQSRHLEWEGRSYCG